MPKLIVVRTTGEEVIIEAKPGQNAMQAMTQNGIHEIVSYCGGACSCGACVVKVDPVFIDRLPAPSKQEKEFLVDMDSQGNTRLSCQIPMTESLDGIRFTPIPTDY